MQFIDLLAQQKRIRAKIESRINHVLDHGQYIMGPEVKELEEKLRAFVGTSHCITCSSGTDALLIVLMALDIGPGDEVITVPYTWISHRGSHRAPERQTRIRGHPARNLQHKPGS